MSIKLPKPKSGMYILGNDHTWECQISWGDNSPATPVENIDDCTFIFKLKEHALDNDADALVLLSSEDNSEQFTVTDIAEATFTFWLKSTDQSELEAGVSYYIELILVMVDGKTRTYIKDNIKFTQGL